MLSRKMRLVLDWKPRDLNQSADDLTNADWDAFDPDKRVRLDLAHFNGIVFKDLLAVGGAYERELAELKARKQTAPSERKRKHSLTPW